MLRVALVVLALLGLVVLAVFALLPALLLGLVLLLPALFPLLLAVGTSMAAEAVAAESPCGPGVLP